MVLTPVYRHTLDAAALVAEFPPRWGNANKLVVHNIACPSGCVHRGQITVSRWPAPPLPDRIDLAGPAVIESHPGVFDYVLPSRETLPWYLNFAHYDLFCCYGSGLLAQDELQVAEHPALGSLREMLIARGISPLTVQDDQPTPILISGVERRCEIATDPNDAQGRPHGLYGNRFMAAPADVVARATRAIEPPTVSNILAMEAPIGSGPYSRAEIAFILRSALTGFTAVRVEAEGRLDERQIEVHTGYWGCGAYGGNRVLMALLQIIAASASGIDRLVFHTMTAEGMAPLQEARQRFTDEIAPLGPKCKGDLLVMKIANMGFVWGEGDGN
jgi:hypothetical protein